MPPKISEAKVYRPSDQAVQALGDVTLVAVVGPSGVGKTTLMNGAIALDPQIHLVLSDTSRYPRPEETDGVDYYFRSRDEMLELVEKRAFVQVAPGINGDLYATRPESYGRQGIAMMAIWAEALPTFRVLNFKATRVIFVIPPTFEIWQARMGIHEFTAEQQTKRLAEAKRSLSFALQDEQTSFVINNELDQAEADFMELALGRSPSPKLAADQDRARAIITAILGQLP